MRSPPEDRSIRIEQLLLDYAQRIAKHTAGRRAIILHLSRLRPSNRHGHHIRIAANAFEELVKPLEGQIFVLANADIVFVCKGANTAILDDAVMRIRYLFGEDPLAKDAETGEPSEFASWFDLGVEHEAFLEVVRRLHDAEMERRNRLAAIAGTGQVKTPQKRPLSPRSLAELADVLANADLSNMLRRQAVCVIAADGPPKRLFQEVYVSIAELANAIMPTHDLAADHWLFQHLTQSLDRRVLAMLKRDGETLLTTPVSLNLNVSTLLTPEFLNFDSSLRTGMRGGIVIEVQLADVYTDIGAFLFARDFVRERGYRVCLDGLTDLTLPFVDRDRLGLDLVKVFWNPDMAHEAQVTRADAFGASAERIGRARLILARCDSETAVAFGRRLGIALFQGRHIDKLATPPLYQRSAERPKVIAFPPGARV